MKLKIAIAALVVFALSILSLFVYFYYIPHPAADFGGESKYLYIRKGETAEQIAANLESLGAISSKSDFLFFARLLGKADKLKGGRYAIKPNSSLSYIIGITVRGETAPFDVTVPEGYSLAQVKNLLAASIEFDTLGFMEAVTDSQYLDSLRITASNLEGYLAPSTYNMYFEENPRRVVSRMVKHFYDSLPDSFTIKAHRLGLTFHQAVTLASLIEKEARLDDERPLIAAVYLNRLRKGMRLECDPTVIYALGGLNRPLLRGDLDVDSPYNTYLNYGLPPGPIANPGVESLKAAVNPADAGYLYFVARGDGSHVFSYSLNDHINATNRIKRLNGNG